MWDLEGKMIFVIACMAVQDYLYSLDASADDLSVVVFGAQRTRMLALPQEVKSTTVTCPLRTVTVEEKTVQGEMNTKFKYFSLWVSFSAS